jgi:hypothetical protein
METMAKSKREERHEREERIVRGRQAEVIQITKRKNMLFDELLDLRDKYQRLVSDYNKDLAYYEDRLRAKERECKELKKNGVQESKES